MLARMEVDDAMPFAGPDSVGSLDLPRLPTRGDAAYDLAFGFRRLAILDPSPAGHQPMRTLSGSHWIVFNGEIYNHWDLRAELEALGHSFTTRCDAETLLAALVEWGPAATDKLEGMWAFACWSVAEKTLLLSRDRPGIKPLYFTEHQGRFGFASEIRSLLELTGMERRCHPQRAFDFLRFGVTDDGDTTFFDGIRQLPPAHSLRLDLTSGKTELTRYWEPPTGPADRIDATEAAEQVRTLFCESIDAHLLSDVPVGVALSGGIDSSAVLAAMTRDASEKSPTRAFGFVAEQHSLDESRWMKIAAENAGARLETTKPGSAELARDMGRLIDTQEQPFGSTSIYAQHRVCQLARQHEIPVLLSGQGADELLAGYLPYIPARAASLVGSGSLGRAVRFLRSSCANPGVGPRWLIPRLANMMVPGWLEAPARRIGGEPLAPSWIESGWFEKAGVSLTSRREPRSRERLRDRLRQAFSETSLPMLLRFEDRNSMAFSIESRVPFLHRPLIERLLTLPESLLIDDRARTKAVFRDAMRGMVPDPILDRRDKIGFTPPEQVWLEALQPIVDSTLLGDGVSRIRGLNPQALHADWEAVRRGHGGFDFRFWRGINLVLWADRFSVSFDDSGLR